MNVQIESAKAAVVRVGDGRGFVVNNGHDRLILTAAHCLPQLPPAGYDVYSEERTYAELIGPVNAEETTISVECLFVDPVSDIAALGHLDDQVYYAESEQFQIFTEALSALRIEGAPERLTAWALDLNCEWFECCVEFMGPRLHIVDAEKPIVGGMSGSPVVDANGAAIGIICMGSGKEGSTRSSGNPRLEQTLPGWLLQN